MKGRDGGGKCVVLEEALCISDWMLICRSRSRVTNALHTHIYIYIYRTSRTKCQSHASGLHQNKRGQKKGKDFSLFHHVSIENQITPRATATLILSILLLDTDFVFSSIYQRMCV